MHKIKRLLRYDWPLHFVLLFTNWFPDNVALIRIRGRLATPFFKKCGKNLGLGRNLTFYDPSKIEIGKDVYIAYGCWFSAGFGICIGDEAQFGPYVVLTTASHTRQDRSYRYGLFEGQQILIGKGTWIGAHCILAAGTQIGNGSAVGANSFVNSIIPEDVVCAGSPVKVIKVHE